MPETLDKTDAVRPEAPASVQDALAEVTALLRKHRLVEGLVRQQVGHPPSEADAELTESAVYKDSKAALQRELDRLHPADIAYILEALPLDERLYVWDLVRASRDGDILLEVSDAVRESLISSMDTEELVAATETLETDEIAELAPDLPQEVMDDVFQSLPVEEREQLRAAMSFDEDMVGALMDFEDIAVRPDVTLEVVLRYLRRFDELPTQTDQIFVVDRDERLLGMLPVNTMLVTDPETTVGAVMKPPVVKLRQHEKADVAASAFERYDLVSAPVVDTQRPARRAASPSTRYSTSSDKAARKTSSHRPACAKRRTSSRRCGRRSGTAGRGLPSTSSPRSSRPGHRHLRRFDRTAGRARRTDADRRWNRWQLGQPDDHDDRARRCAWSGDDRQRAPADPQGDHA